MPALRVFILLGAGFFTLGLVAYVVLRHETGSSIDLIYRYSGSRTRREAVIEYITQATTILDLLVPLTLLLSRSFKSVKVLLSVVLIPNVVACAVAVVGHDAFGVVWAAAMTLYIGYVITRVGGAESIARSSYRGGEQRGYSTFEVALAGYMVLMMAAYGVLTFDAYRATAVDTPSNPATIVYSNGSTSRGPASDPAPAAYVEQTAYAHEFKVVLSFDPNSWASVTYQPSRTVGTLVVPANDAVNVTGDALNSTNQMTITVVHMGPQPTGVPNPAACPVNDLLFKTTIMGQPAAVCGFTGGANPLALAFFTTGGSWYKVEFLTMPDAGVTPPLSVPTLETITSTLKVG